nr:MAG TPA: hypothetical protein [Bacteriophage sp.]
MLKVLKLLKIIFNIMNRNFYPKLKKLIIN